MIKIEILNIKNKFFRLTNNKKRHMGENSPIKIVTWRRGGWSFIYMRFSEFFKIFNS